MQLEFRTADKIKSGTLVEFAYGLDSTMFYYGIYLTDMDGKNPVIYDLEDDVYYSDIERYKIRIVPVDKNIKLVIE